MTLEDISDEMDREIVKLARGIYDEFTREVENKTTISSKVKNFDKVKLAQMIVGLIKSRHATLEQIKVMADYYDVDLEDTLNSLETTTFEN